MKKKLSILFIVLVLSLVFLGAGFNKENTEKTVELPILMYHAVLNSKTGVYVVSEKQLEDDFIALKELGYNTVFLSEVIDWVDGKTQLPKKPILLTFDDGHYNNMHYALPLAKKHDIKFMIFPITAFSKFSTESGDHSNPNYSHLTAQQLVDCANSGHIELGAHTHNMHKFKPRYGIAKMENETIEEYTAALSLDITKANDFITLKGATKPTSFAYPFGKYCKLSKQILLDHGFRALLTCNEGVNKIVQGKPETLHSLKRFNRSGVSDTHCVFANFTDTTRG